MEEKKEDEKEKQPQLWSRRRWVLEEKEVEEEK